MLPLYREHHANSKGNTSSEWPFLRKEKTIEIMSAEEFDKRKPIPEGLKKILERLAKETVRNGWDAGKVIIALQRGLTWWSSLTPEEREAIRTEFRREPIPRVAQRKPRRYG